MKFYPQLVKDRFSQTIIVENAVSIVSVTFEFRFDCEPDSCKQVVGWNPARWPLKINSEFSTATQM